MRGLAAAVRAAQDVRAGKKPKRRRDAIDAILDGADAALAAVGRAAGAATVATGEAVGRAVMAGAEHVDAYIRRDGTRVRAHERSKGADAQWASEAPTKSAGAHAYYTRSR